MEKCEEPSASSSSVVAHTIGREPEHLIWSNSIRVKNTFLHTDQPWAESLKGFEPVRRQNSEPTSGSSQIGSSGSQEGFYRPVEVHTPVRASEIPITNSYHETGAITNERNEQGNEFTDADLCQELGELKSKWVPEWSVGSGPNGDLHDSGKCKPCAWSWKPRGCARGKDCDQCHMCDMEALKRYRKNRYLGLKANRAKKRQANRSELPPTGRKLSL